MFLTRAIEIAQEILSQHSKQIDSIQLAPGRDGVFTVLLDDDILFEMGENGIQPSVEALLVLVDDRLT
jgi:predicted Rdx family selenoprotein